MQTSSTSLLSYVALVALGCSSPDPARDVCPSDAGLLMADLSDNTDYRIDLDTSSALAAFADRASTNVVDVGLKGGRISFHTDDPACVASSDHPCSIELRQLALQFGAMELPTSVATAHVGSLQISAEVPISLVNSGSGYVMQGDAMMRFNASIDSHDDSKLMPLGDHATIIADIPNRLLSVSLWIPFDVRISANGSCTTASSALSFVASAESEWELPSL